MHLLHPHCYFRVYLKHFSALAEQPISLTPKRSFLGTNIQISMEEELHGRKYGVDLIFSLPIFRRRGWRQKRKIYAFVMTWCEKQKITPKPHPPKIWGTAKSEWHPNQYFFEFVINDSWVWIFVPKIAILICAKRIFGGLKSRQTFFKKDFDKP